MPIAPRIPAWPGSARKIATPIPTGTAITNASAELTTVL